MQFCVYFTASLGKKKTLPGFGKGRGVPLLLSRASGPRGFPRIVVCLGWRSCAPPFVPSLSSTRSSAPDKTAASQGGGRSFGQPSSRQLRASPASPTGRRCSSYAGRWVGGFPPTLELIRSGEGRARGKRRGGPAGSPPCSAALLLLL